MKSESIVRYTEKSLKIFLRMEYVVFTVSQVHDLIYNRSSAPKTKAIVPEKPLYDTCKFGHPTVCLIKISLFFSSSDNNPRT